MTQPSFLSTNVKQPWLALCAIALLCLSAPLLADSDGPVPKISVTGEGRADMVPDMAVLSLTVMREEPTARAALDANSAAMAEVIEAMGKAGVAERDLQTSNFSIQPRMHYPRPRNGEDNQAPRVIGYTVRNSLSVRVRDTSKLGEILDLAVTLGVNQGGQITWSNEDPSAALTRARTEAVKDAMGRAETLAKAAGVKLGDLLQLSEQTHRPRPMPMASAEISMARAADAVPVAVGENSYRVTVSASFRIEQ